uniref:Uncharacterized protein n=1 Tax=Cacopsylla melanoneura TaxID=428564 RepID=A0A8D8X500_9HEMI
MTAFFNLTCIEPGYISKPQGNQPSTGTNALAVGHYHQLTAETAGFIPHQCTPSFPSYISDSVGTFPIFSHQARRFELRTDVDGLKSSLDDLINLCMTRIPSRVLATPQTMMTKRVNFLTTCTLMGSTQRTTKPKPDTDTHCIIIQQSSQVRTRNGVEPSTREWILKKFECETPTKIQYQHEPLLMSSLTTFMI